MIKALSQQRVLRNSKLKSLILKRLSCLNYCKRGKNKKHSSRKGLWNYLCRCHPCLAQNVIKYTLRQLKKYLACSSNKFSLNRCFWKNNLGPFCWYTANWSYGIWNIFTSKYLRLLFWNSHLPAKKQSVPMSWSRRPQLLCSYSHFFSIYLRLALMMLSIKTFFL